WMRLLSCPRDLGCSALSRLESTALARIPPAAPTTLAPLPSPLPCVPAPKCLRLAFAMMFSVCRTLSENVSNGTLLRHRARRIGAEWKTAARRNFPRGFFIASAGTLAEARRGNPALHTASRGKQTGNDLLFSWEPPVAACHFI